MPLRAQNLYPKIYETRYKRFFDNFQIPKKPKFFISFHLNMNNFDQK